MTEIQLQTIVDTVIMDTKQLRRTVSVGKRAAYIDGLLTGLMCGALPTLLMAAVFVVTR